MNKFLSYIVLVLPFFAFNQSYAPPVGYEGTTAIYMDSNVFVAWASGIEVYRGYLNIEDKSYEIDGSNKASFGEPENAIGYADGTSTDVVSLGDSGIAIMTFNKPIINGPGYDFAVFENSFNDDYLELAHVEVSSDGEHYVRFPSHSEVQTQEQTGSFGSTDAREIYNLAGKYRGGYGTPFDLKELKDSAGIDVNSITHVKIIDVVGSIGEGGTNDSFGNRINEPFPTAFESGGFDLDAVGVIHQLAHLDELDHTKMISVYPNPFQDYLTVESKNTSPFQLTLLDASGKIIFKKDNITEKQKLTLNTIEPGVYFICIAQENHIIRQKVIKQ